MPTQLDDIVTEMDDPAIPADAEPLLRLWAAVLKQGIDDAVEAIRWRETGRCRFTQASGYNPREALRWLKSRATHTGSLEWLCDVLQLNADAARVYIEQRAKELCK